MRSYYEYLTEATVAEEYRRYVNKLTNEEFRQLATADPMSKDNFVGKYTKWIIREYLKLNKELRKRFIAEDLTKIKKYLTDYDNMKSKNKLTDEYKNILNLDISKLKQLSDTLADEVSKPNYSVTKKDYTTVFASDGWYVYVPNTYEASKHLGQGTHWCTAADSDEGIRRYEEYTATDKLYIIVNGTVLNTKEKWQLHPESRQFMNYLDEPDVESISMFPESIREFVFDKCPELFEIKVYVTDDEFRNTTIGYDINQWVVSDGHGQWYVECNYDLRDFADENIADLIHDLAFDSIYNILEQINDIADTEFEDSDDLTVDLVREYDSELDHVFRDALRKALEVETRYIIDQTVNSIIADNLEHVTVDGFLSGDDYLIFDRSKSSDDSDFFIKYSTFNKKIVPELDITEATEILDKQFKNVNR